MQAPARRRFFSRALPVVLCASSLLWMGGCDGGIMPPAAGAADSTITGISGTVFFQNWPPQDSLLDLRIVVFREFPPEDILLEIITGEAFAYPAVSDSFRLPLFVDQLDFLMELPPGEYSYLVVAQQFGPNIQADWRAVGQYDTDSDSLPSSIAIQQGELLENLLIPADFDNLPVQPF